MIEVPSEIPIRSRFEVSAGIKQFLQIFIKHCTTFKDLASVKAEIRYVNEHPTNPDIITGFVLNMDCYVLDCFGKQQYFFFQLNYYEKQTTQFVDFMWRFSAENKLTGEVQRVSATIGMFDCGFIERKRFKELEQTMLLIIAAIMPLR